LPEGCGITTLHPQSPSRPPSLTPARRPAACPLPSPSPLPPARGPLPRVEARNALSKLEYLYSLVQLNRSELPWGSDTASERTTIWEEPLEGAPGSGSAARR
jgi:hypothetical protein